MHMLLLYSVVVVVPFVFPHLFVHFLSDAPLML